MGIMKDFDIRIRNGGDDAVGAVNELMAELQRRLLELQASMPRWIPVTERLPPDDDPVLVSWSGSMVGIAWITKKGNWRDIEGKFPRVVTHWMPLPPAAPMPAK